MSHDEYDQNIHIFRTKGKNGAKDEVNNQQDESDLLDFDDIEQYDSSYQHILTKLLDTGLISDSDLALISASVDENVIPFALKDRLSRLKKSKEYKTTKHAKDLGHFADKINDLTVGKESGNYTESKGHDGPITSKAIDDNRQQPEPEKKPGSAPFKGPDSPAPPSAPTPSKP